MPPNFWKASNITKLASIETQNLPMGNTVKLMTSYLGNPVLKSVCVCVRAHVHKRVLGACVWKPEVDVMCRPHLPPISL